MVTFVGGDAGAIISHDDTDPLRILFHQKRDRRRASFAARIFDRIVDQIGHGLANQFAVDVQGYIIKRTKRQGNTRILCHRLIHFRNIAHDRGNRHIVEVFR